MAATIPTNPTQGGSAMEASHPALKSGDRVTVEVTGTVSYHGDFSLSLKVPNVHTDVRLDNQAFRVTRVRGPALDAGDRAYSAILEEFVEIVLRDDGSNTYVVRRPNGKLFVHADDDDLTAASSEEPVEEAAAGIVDRSAA